MADRYEGSVIEAARTLMGDHTGSGDSLSDAVRAGLRDWLSRRVDAWTAGRNDEYDAAVKALALAALAVTQPNAIQVAAIDDDGEYTRRVHVATHHRCGVWVVADAVPPSFGLTVTHAPSGAAAARFLASEQALAVSLCDALPANVGKEGTIGQLPPWKPSLVEKIRGIVTRIVGGSSTPAWDAELARREEEANPDPFDWSDAS